jgi:hypothetical protein
LRSPQGVKVDLLFASSGIEADYARKQDLSAKLTTLLKTSH